MQSPLPDWNKTRVFLVDPTIWKEYQQTQKDLRPVYQELRNALDLLGAEFRIVSREDNPVDIWIRDWGFIEGAYFRFDPSYAKNFYSQTSILLARKALSRVANCTPHQVSLILDGGNLVHNGKIAILTEKALTDNPDLSRVEIERMIIALGFERTVFIPVEPDDIIGHADGILRFISPTLLLVNDYQGTHFKSYRARLLDVLNSALPDMEIVPFPWFSTDDEHNGIWSAVGTYINFIYTENGIVYPVFEHRLDEKVSDLLIRELNLPAQPVTSTPLARLGGVLNCITLTI